MRIQVTIETPSVRRPRRVMAALVVALALAVPGVALASHVFADVPDANPFHANITNLARSGVTAGCGGDNFCPSTAVTREQMAAFLNRGLGRGTIADLGGGTVSTTADSVLGSFTITPGIPNGAVPGAAQVVEVTSLVSIELTNATGCPCIYRSNIRIDGNYANVRVADVSVDTVGQRAQIVVIGAATVTGSEPVLIEVELFRVSGGGTATGAGQAIASTYAFTGNGSNTFGAMGVPSGDAPTP